MTKSLKLGSIWHRWDPHLHGPGTLMNDQFRGDDPWGEYFDAIEAADPPIKALGITDYYLTDAYEHVVKATKAGRLSGVELVFPNVECRLDVGTGKGKWVNVHLLVSPEQHDHLLELGRFMARLSFRAHDDEFACKPEELIRLGKAADSSITDDRVALRHGAGQFKVSFDQLREEFDKSGWARRNLIVAVAGSSTDGTSGVRSPADTTIREEVEKFASVIFASSRAQRDFWLGRGNVSIEQLWQRYDGPKPCLHGCDCHRQPSVAAPDDSRYCWVKGRVDFDSLRQACIDPENRAFVDANPPGAGLPSQSIAAVTIARADWVVTPALALNPGLVAVIGPRGSGKTALADIIAMGADAIRERPAASTTYPSSSFLARAGTLVGDAEVTLEWRSGEVSERALDGTKTPEVAYPRVRYLSQQFVEELCSATGVTDELLREIERVVFESHPVGEQGGALDFGELLELRASRHRASRQRDEQAIATLSERIGTELERDRELPGLERAVVQKSKQIERLDKDRAKLVSKGAEARASRLTEVATAAEKVRGHVRRLSNQEQALLALQDEVRDLRQNTAPEMLRESKERHAASQMNPQEWETFKIDYTGDVDAQISLLLDKSRELAQARKGVAPPSDSPEKPLDEMGEELTKIPLARLETEINQLQLQINADSAAQRQFAALTKRIAADSAALQQLEAKREEAKGAKERAKQLQVERERAYQRVFEAIVAEEQVLKDLYAPVVQRVQEASGTLGKLTFTVSRTADVSGWSRVAEQELLDLRRQGPFKGSGQFEALAEAALKQAWEQGDASQVAEAMRVFRNSYQGDLLEHANVHPSGQPEYRAWLKSFAGWLFSTSHIELAYGISYEGVDIRKLSPGTRGIVLLLLYLALDDTDDRPLIIDQPEENLDPKSVFDELVGLFIAVKARRQVIIVTHNANLVVNTDADQIIVASCGPHAAGELPPISYDVGGIEESAIRTAVCDVLEGGEHAFRERARRLRVHLRR
ncbi:MAG: AAA family ATPase [Acidobacteria bacterium]|nr:AAA family ATPase [Acidobacteriota bacterium]